MEARTTNGSSGFLPGCLTRYVAFEYLGVFGLTLAGITTVLILAIVGEQGLRQGLGWGPLLRITPFILPVALRFAIPTAVLLATCIIFGRISADNEVVAVKSLGIGPTVFLRPALMMGALTTVVAMFVNDLAVSWGRQGTERVLVESVEEIAYRLLRSQRSYSSPVFSIMVRDVQNRQLIGPVVVLKGKAGQPATRITARVAELRANPIDGTFSILLTDSTMSRGDVYVRYPKTKEWAIPLIDATRKGNNSRSTSQIALARIPAQRTQQRDQIQRIQAGMAARAAHRMITGDFRALADPQWLADRQQLETARGRLQRLRLEPWRRYAEGSSCFFFVVIGAPLAIRMRTANFFTTFAVCFFPVLLIYYPMLELAVDRAKAGGLPLYSVWSGNLALAVLGGWVLRYVVRH